MLDLRPFLALWLIVIAAAVGLALWRRSVGVKEDPTLHLGDDLSSPAQQVVIAKKLLQIDKWVKLMTVAAIILGVLLGAAYLYRSWVLGPTAGL